MIILPTLALALNYFLLGTQYFRDSRNFLPPTFITIIVLVLAYMSGGRGSAILQKLFKNKKWRVGMDETENFKRQNLQSQLEGLKGQVNPHFLFNSLNSLSSLIADEPAKAEKFLDEMSKVYRYLLRDNEAGLATLDAELQFIGSYFHLLKTRYGEGLDMELKINEHYLNYLLPPLTLQMLVENAVKHNMILKDCPLRILIATANNGKLYVSNNLQRKERDVITNKAGLDNIAKKYELLGEASITVKDDGNEFCVAVPLIRCG